MVANPRTNRHDQPAATAENQNTTISSLESAKGIDAWLINLNQYSLEQYSLEQHDLEPHEPLRTNR